MDKLIRRHPTSSATKVKDIDEVWANWEKIKEGRRSTAPSINATPRSAVSRNISRPAPRRKAREESAQGEGCCQQADEEAHEKPRSPKETLFTLAETAHPRLVR